MKHLPRLLLATATLVAASSAHAAIVTWSSDAFDADADISTQGTLISAINLGSTTGVTVNTVLFAGEAVSTSSFFTTTATDATNVNYYQGGAIGSLSSLDAQALLDNLEFGATANNSLARLTGLTIGQQYQVQLLIVDDNTAGRTVDVGYSNISGGAEVYTPSNVDISGSAGASMVKVFTGTFTADASGLQDLHVAISGTGGAFNGQVNAFQLRAVPEPSTYGLMGAGALASVAFVRRRRKLAGKAA